MKRRFTKYPYYPWKLKAKLICKQFILPILIFQTIRTLLFITFLDVMLLILLMILAIVIYFEII